MFSDLVSTPLSRRTTIRGGIALGAGMAATTLPLGAPAFAQSASAAGRWPSVAQFIDSYVDTRKVAGMVAAMGFGQRAPDFLSEGARTFGGADAVGPDTLFRIYSMTKPITGMAVMMLVDEGALGLDQPLHEILPAFRNMQVQKQYDGPITADNLEPAARPITIRHLLTHTAGLGYTIVQNGPIKAAYSRAGLVPFSASRMALAQDLLGGTPAPSLAAFADRLAQVPLVRQPGSRWSYSVATDLLGRVIEVASGMDFAAFLQQRFFTPLGMDSTFFRVPQGEANRLSGNYFLMGGVPVPIDLPGSSVFLDEPAFPFGGAGLVSTARDYDRFLQMLAGYGEIDGQRVMSEAAVRLGTSDLFPETLAANGRFTTSDGRSFGFGAAGLVGQGEADGLFGWFGAAGTAGLVNMRVGLRHTLMTQYMPAENYDVQQRFPIVVAQDAMRMLPS
ncbi:serine hydrolase domain-containing protein [Aurantiacibacter aquimixticola]|uniref:Class A beta-lactamase-related serine hydrolase n=1 Tax=Aurantiacibacter aquimixticola TaxID=1958945 RepID=A0A419RQJ8_9SPHN|nr:serine hydrolase domain-containing protein [Aurantiacibacter aquimixticola]RJY08040.1 class A beta-lactamase-related serine hydrolase [Aurantiacibacter aquimixticola]